MSTPSPKTVTILGSSGLQGASVLHYLLQLPTSDFNIRAITTRPVHSPSLPDLSMHPNMSIHFLRDTTSKDELVELFKGSQAVFANTNSLDSRYDGKPGSPTEIQALHAVVDAAVDANVELLLLSCLPDLGKLTQSYHDFANKVNGTNYARQIAKATGLKVVYIQLGWYITNFIDDHDPAVNEKDGVVEFFMRGLKQDKPGTSCRALDLSTLHITALLNSPIFT